MSGLLGLAAPAQATILTFGIAGLNRFDSIPSTYGDHVVSTSDGSFSYGEGNGFTPHVTVDYATRFVTTGAVFEPHLEFWPTSYGDLVNVAYPSYTSRFFGEVALTPETGFAVKLNGFDLGGWPNKNYTGQTIRILDDLGLLQEWTDFTVLGAGPTHSPFSFPTGLLSRSGPLRIQYAFNQWNVGIDNIHFEEVAAVPLPGAVLLMGSGLAGLALFGRRSHRRLKA